MQMISVIVPVYKVEQYINKCIESILNQTFTDFELILVNDGSPDNCPIICDEWAKKDNRIKVIHKENGGVISARKKGLDVAQGEFIIFVDSDDYIDDNMFSDYMKVVNEHNPDFVQGGFVYEFPNQIVESPSKFALADVKDIKNMVIPDLVSMNLKSEFTVFGFVCAGLFKRSILNKAIMLVPNELTIKEDRFMMLAYLFECKKIAILNNDTSYHYLQRDESATRSNIDFMLEQSELFWKNVVSLLNSENVQTKTMDEYLDKEYAIKIFTTFFSNQLAMNKKADINKIRNAISKKSVLLKKNDLGLSQWLICIFVYLKMYPLIIDIYHTIKRLKKT